MCNQYKDKPMPFGAKVRKVFNKSFYLSRDDMSELIIKIETQSLRRVEDVVSFIDDRGEWLDG